MEETSLGQIKKLDNCMIEAKESSTSAETCDGLDTGDKLCPESTAGSMTSVWCPIKLHTEIIDVRGSDLPTIESVKKSHRGPIVTSVLLSADARFKDRMVTLESPLLEKRFSIQFLKDLNRASDYNSVVEATSNGFAGTSRILYATKEKMGYIDIAAVSGPNTVVAVDSGIIVSSRDNALNERVTQLLKDSSNGSPVLEINHDIQCDSMPLDAQWFASFVLEILLKPRKELKEPTDEDINARNVAVTMLSNFINNADNVSAPVFIEALITAFKRIILSPLQRDPELFVHFYRKKEYATVKGSQTYKHLWTSDSFWLFRLLKSTQSSASPSWWVNDAGGLDALTLKAVAESIRTTDKYFGENHLAWDWHRLHGSFLTRSVRFPFSPSGVDFAKGLIAGPYFLPGSTNSIFQNGYDANIEITPKYGHPLSSRECMRSTFR